MLDFPVIMVHFLDDFERGHFLNIYLAGQSCFRIQQEKYTNNSFMLFAYTLKKILNHMLGSEDRIRYVRKVGNLRNLYPIKITDYIPKHK